MALFNPCVKILPLMLNAFEFKCTRRGNAQFQKVQKFWSLSKNSWHMHVWNLSYLRATLISSLPGGETKASRADRAERADKGRLGSQRMAKRLARKEAKSLIQLFFPFQVRNTSLLLSHYHS